MSKLLIDESPMMFQPSLAVALGAENAIFIQQLHWLLNGIYSYERDGARWVRKTYPEWHEFFPFWSERTIKRLTNALRQDGLILIAKHGSEWEHALSYTINREAMEELERKLTPRKPPAPPTPIVPDRTIDSATLSLSKSTDQKGTIDSDKVALSTVPKWHDVPYVYNRISIENYARAADAPSEEIQPEPPQPEPPPPSQPVEFTPVLEDVQSSVQVRAALIAAAPRVALSTQAEAPPGFLVDPGTGKTAYWILREFTARSMTEHQREMVTETVRDIGLWREVCKRWAEMYGDEWRKFGHLDWYRQPEKHGFVRVNEVWMRKEQADYEQSIYNPNAAATWKNSILINADVDDSPITF